ncbi:phage tail protein [Pelomonas sp. Root1444]|uniref:phage tail protein n=1 Tax=Pelomonas sp. Root1444 TaxID=1736464 RepID=UPI0007024E19|nr:tail fiber protein [Pelomonas sp. Root1444]KQY90603.1 phage tail protein [Pelomonas sp. Root1444]
MSDPFLGELKLLGFGYAPKGWAFCNGQLLPINQNQALFALLGTTYGGDGRVNFALPDLRGRAPAHVGSDIALGQRGGQENVTLQPGQLPAHTHTLSGTNDFANASVPGGALPAAKVRGGMNRYGPAGNDTVMGASALGASGGGQPHPNMQPFAVLNWAIALQGIFPSRD